MRKDYDDKPLVSVIVITYNSSDFVIETLESIKSQLYKNLELIITDDKSSDDTIKKCGKWIDENEKYFGRIKLLETDKNTGIPGNCNRGIEVAEGSWIKVIAGDDILLDNCIKDTIDYALENANCKIVISNAISFLDKTEPKEIIEITKPYWGKRQYPITAEEQYSRLLLSYCGNTPTLFVKREVFDSIKYDENFPLLEDYPFLLNATKNGFYVHYLDKETVLFRQRKESVYAGDNDRLFKDYYKKSKKFNQIYRLPNLPIIIKLYEIQDYYRLSILDALKLNQKRTLDKFVFAVTRYLNPFRYIIYMNDFLYKLKNN